MEMSSKHNVMRVPNFLGGKKCKLLQNNFFIDSKRRHFIERSHYDDERNPYCERFLEPIPLLFWYLIGIGCVYGEHVKISSTSFFYTVQTRKALFRSSLK